MMISCVLLACVVCRTEVAARTAGPESPLTVADSSYRQVIREGALRMSCYLNYPQGSARVQAAFGNNAAELARLDEFIQKVFRDSLIYVDSIRLCGYCSVEGAYDLNERLARNRAVGFKNYVDGKYGLSSRYPVRVDWVAEDWDELYDMVEASQMAYREQVLALIDGVGLFEGREKRLMDLKGGVPYKYMMKEFFPALRRVEIVVDYDLHRILEEKLQRKLNDEEFQAALDAERAAAEAEELRLAEEARRREAERVAAIEAQRLAAERAAFEEQERLRAEAAARQEAQRQAELAAQAARLQAAREALAARTKRRESRREARKLRPILAVKTDLVAWAGVCPDFKRTTFMPNLEAELYFARRWSVAASGLYADWEYDGGKQFWGYSAFSGEVRLWLRGNGLFRGFYVGAYGEAGDFDNQRDRRDDAVTTTNYTGTFWSAGISAGYLLPLSRHWNLELSLRGGYRSASYDSYDRELPYLYYSASGSKNEFALTGLRLNVVYRFGRGRH